MAKAAKLSVSERSKVSNFHLTLLTVVDIFVAEFRESIIPSQSAISDSDDVNTFFSDSLRKIRRAGYRMLPKFPRRGHGKILFEPEYCGLFADLLTCSQLGVRLGCARHNI